MLAVDEEHTSAGHSCCSGPCARRVWQRPDPRPVDVRVPHRRCATTNSDFNGTVFRRSNVGHRVACSDDNRGSVVAGMDVAAELTSARPPVL
jgi:hypothetical protein